MIASIVNFFLRPRYLYKSSVTGKFVSKAFALANPDSTFRMRVK